MKITIDGTKVLVPNDSFTSKQLRANDHLAMEVNDGQITIILSKETTYIFATPEKAKMYVDLLENTPP